MKKETETSTDTWDSLTLFLHWISAIWVLGLIGLGLAMVNLVHTSGQKFELYQFHKSYGLLFAAILICRLFWKFLSPPRKISDAGMLRKLAIVNQNLMLCMLVLLITSGYALSSFSMIPIPINVLGWNAPSLLQPDLIMEQWAKEAHHYIAFFLTALVLIHIGAALFHHFILKDQTLTRMLKK